MISYRSCSGCKWLRVSSFGLDCTATFSCRNQIDYRPFWADKTTAPQSYSATMRPTGYRTPEDGLRNIERRTEDHATGEVRNAVSGE